MNIAEIVQRAESFRATLTKAKTPQSFQWYPYDSLSNWIHIERLLTEPNRILPGGNAVLDIGCADGDLAFFLESLGYRVTVIDYPPTNHNGMLGVRKLKEVLKSRIEILAMDVDNQFSLPNQTYGLALVLGALYHLKNPFYLLETVSKYASHVLLSTRIAKHVPGVPGALNQVSVAYLLGERECNGDKSNYWIFTEAGFRQMLRRTNWDVLDLKTFGDTQASDPVHAEHDERLFCFAHSRYAMGNVELLQGWHEPEDTGWRWTERKFSLRIQMPQGTANGVLKVKLFIPNALLERHGSLTIMPNGETYHEGGEYELLVDMGPQDGMLRDLSFTLDHALPPDAEDNRERGIIVHSIEV